MSCGVRIWLYKYSCIYVLCYVSGTNYYTYITIIFTDVNIKHFFKFSGVFTQSKMFYVFTVKTCA